MCNIVGAIFSPSTSKEINTCDDVLHTLMYIGHKRGRDGRGYHLINETESVPSYRTTSYSSEWSRRPIVQQAYRYATFLANMRAEPTTEYVLEKTPADQQPYALGGWHIVHNGTIANDKELRTYLLKTRIDSAAIVEQLYKESNVDKLSVESAFKIFLEVVRRIKGSYAILAAHKDCPGVIFTAANYRPIWYSEFEGGAYFSSTREMPGIPTMLEPYTASIFFQSLNGETVRRTTTLRENKPNKKALVVCSGGLDSVVAACKIINEGYETELIHFMYGSRAERPEVNAVKDVAEYLNIGYTLFPLPVYKPGDSPLLDAAAKVAGGEAGAEFAHEWVPARNLLLLSVATAYAEANGFDTIALGNNLEEAGAYPDNEPEFIDKFNDILPFAVGDGKNVRVIMPVGNYMKHEIVKLGLELKAPLHLTWSCYRAGEIHCGTCGPCYMRRTAFRINNADEVIQYATNEGF